MEEAEQEAKRNRKPEKSPHLTLKIKKKNLQLTLPNLNKVGMMETKLMRDSIIFNPHETPKVYHRKSLFCLKADSWLRRNIIWLVEWR